MLLFDVTHTSHSTANTGVQRVTRELFRALRAITPVRPVLWDPFACAWREPDRHETDLLETAPSRRPSLRRGARWSWRQRWRGHLDRIRGNPRAVRGNASAFLTTEIFSSTVWESYPHLWSRITGPRIAIFHDAIPLKLPYLTPRGTVRRFPAYLKQLRAFDGVAALSNASRKDLAGYWEWLGPEAGPPMTTIPPGLHLSADPSADSAEQAEPPRILCVGSIEGRKNQATLLRACDQLWKDGESFHLDFVGIANRETGGEAIQLLDALREQGQPVTWHGPVREAELLRLYQACRFTVYPSYYEGFGLPVWESLRHGKPCICGTGGALAETARGGGCLTVESISDPFVLARAVRQLLRDSERRAALAAEARMRRFPTWEESAQKLLQWIESRPTANRRGGSGS